MKKSRWYTSGSFPTGCHGSRPWCNRLPATVHIIAGSDSMQSVEEKGGRLKQSAEEEGGRLEQSAGGEIFFYAR